MKKNQTYESLIDKSIGSMLSAIEIYNKPDFKYREETFAILAVNAWEVLFKARILKLSNYKMRSIYSLKPLTLKTGFKSKKRYVVDTNRTGNPKSISILEAIARLKQPNELPSHLCDNIESLIELRDNAIHFINTNSITKQIQELGFACVKNYISIMKRWCPDRDLGQYNLYLMPLAYIDGRKVVASTFTKEEQKFMHFVKNKIDASDSNEDEDFDIAIKIELNFQKGNSFDGISVKNDKDGIHVQLSEEEIRHRYPWTHKEVCKRSKIRYTNFKQDKDFNAHMKEVQGNEKLCYKRKLDPQSPRSQEKKFYTTNVWLVLDKYYNKK